MDDWLRDLPVFEPGWVWLAGAGPGDAGLLTLHALNGLRQADVIVYDALVDPGILERARPGAVLEYAGKRGGKPSPTQPDITRRLIELAGSGKRVLRLKGGDPFVFGRGGEEALGLAQAGVRFRVIPGITAGIGGLAYAGIPLTHRDTNSAATFITGHDAAGDVAGSVDWAAIARGSPVIVVYMALQHLPAIAERLLKAGRGAEEKVAVIGHATLPGQQVVVATLGTCAAAATAAALKPPVVVVIGGVVDLRADLDWFSALPRDAAVPAS